MIENKLIHSHYETNELQQWGYDAVDEGFSPMEAQLVDSYFKDKSICILDCGCGGGRLSRGLVAKGYKTIIGLDFVFQFARLYSRFNVSAQRGCVNADITNFPFVPNSILYSMLLANLLSFLDSKQKRIKALSSLYQVIQPGGVVLVSVLDYKGRKINYLLSLLLFFARLGGNSGLGRNLPWLKKNGRINRTFLRKNEPTSYWFLPDEFTSEVKMSGFSVHYFGKEKHPVTGTALFYVLQK